jgi:hypothetical protein
MSKLRTITIDPQFLSMSKKKSKTLKSNIPLNEVKLNSNNIRELLLEKLKQHKKNKKTLKNPMVQLNTMDEQSGNEMTRNEQSGNEITRNEMSNNTKIPHTNPSQNQYNPFDLDKELKQLEDITSQNAISTDFQSNIRPDKPYGVLKNGLKPTYKSWSSQGQIQQMPQMQMPQLSMPIQQKPMSFQPITMLNKEPMQEQMSEPMQEPMSEQPKSVPMIQELEVKKVFQLGRNKKNKTVSVLLKNNSTRKKIEGDKVNFKKTNISTVKNFLKKQNLIRFGTTAPNNLLREIYESTKLCGDITNENTKSIIHNFNET